MPELPEVETIVRGLNRKIIGRKIVNIWTDWPKYFRSKGESSFRRVVLNKKIKKVSRKGKNILLELDRDYLVLIHQKLSGHLLVGHWEKPLKIMNLPDKWRGQKWVPSFSKNLKLWNEKNRFIRLIFFLDNDRMLALSDLRRFAKVLSGSKEEIINLDDLASLGPDPIDNDFNFKKFKDLFLGKKGKIKQVILNQGFISGIGNIYADEALWSSKIHPLVDIHDLKEHQLRSLYLSIRRILKKAIKLKGTSIDDFRDVLGNKGRYGELLNAYQREKRPCKRCKTLIKRIKINNRSARFCPKCQKI